MYSKLDNVLGKGGRVELETGFNDGEPNIERSPPSYWLFSLELMKLTCPSSSATAKI